MTACKSVWGKQINFTQRGSYQNRCEAAAISFNCKGYYHAVMYKSFTSNCSLKSLKKVFCKEFEVKGNTKTAKT